VPNPAYPMVSEAHATSRHGRVTAFRVSFSHDMAPGPATDLANYEKTSWVCCSGCRELFNDDPESVLAEAASREKAKAKE
jgi:hypothetical protein